MSFNIDLIINKLKEQEYPLFVSERHLQISFAFAIKEIYKDEYEIIPELPYEKNKSMHIDLVIVSKDKEEKIAFEFKYVVKQGNIKLPNIDRYDLREQSAINIRRSQCYKDINRLETYINSKKYTKGYFLLITNMSGFWKTMNKDTLGYSFNMEDNHVIKPNIYSFPSSSELSKRKEINDIEIANEYKLIYKDYEKDNDNKEFKYLVIEVE